MWGYDPDLDLPGNGGPQDPTRVLQQDAQPVWSGPDLNLGFDVSSNSDGSGGRDYEPSMAGSVAQSANGHDVVRGAKRYNSETAVDAAWVNLSNKQPRQCWETGFWSNIFSDSPMTFQNPVFNSMAFDRPAYVADPLEDVSSEAFVFFGAQA